MNNLIKKIINNMNIIYIIIFIFLLICEIMSLVYSFFLSLNTFLLVLIWFNFIYKFLGLTQIETELRNQMPIKFSLSINYIYKLIRRGIKIKYLLIKRVIKEKDIIDLLFIIFFLGITLLILRYCRFIFIWEAITNLEICGKLLNLVAILIALTNINVLLELIKEELINILEKVYKTPDYQYYVNKIETKSETRTSLDKLKEGILMMRRYGETTIAKVKEAVEKAREDISKLPPEKLLNDTGIISSTEKLPMPKYRAVNGEYYPVEQLHNIQHYTDGIAPYIPTDTTLIDSFLALPVSERANYITNNLHGFAQQMKLYMKILKKEIRNKDIDYTSQAIMEAFPIESKLYYEKCEDFRKLYMDLYWTDEDFKMNMDKKKMNMDEKELFTIFFFEEPVLPVVGKNKEKLLHIPPMDNSDLENKNKKFVPAQPDAHYVNDGKEGFIQLKTWTDFTTIAGHLEKFGKKYSNTDQCSLVVGNQIIHHINHFDSTDVRKRNLLGYIRFVEDLPSNADYSNFSPEKELHENVKAKLKDMENRANWEKRERWEKTYPKFDLNEVHTYLGKTFSITTTWKHRSTLIRVMEEEIKKNNDKYGVD